MMRHEATIEPATARAYRALERMIVTLELAPAALTTEGALIEKLGLGRTPVREALQRLSWEGLVEVRPRAGLAVAALHPSDWLRVLDARQGVELVLARSAARWLSRPAMAGFEQAASAMEKAASASDVLAFLDADKTCDEAMAAACDNPFAVRLAAPLQTHSRRFWFRYRSDQAGLSESAERHLAIVKAVLRGDSERAAAEMSRLMTMLRRHAEEAMRG